MKFGRLCAIAVMALVALLSGCASIPMADPAADRAAKAFTVSPGKSKIYVYRNESMGAAIKMTVLIDGHLFGETIAKSYLVTEVEPGAHRLTGKAENEHVLELTTVAGRSYYVWQEVKMGLLYARNELRLVDETAGRAGVMECNLAAHSR